jgi:hypothetical protein
MLNSSSVKAGRGSGFTIRRSIPFRARMSRRRGGAQEFVTAAGEGGRSAVHGSRLALTAGFLASTKKVRRPPMRKV